MILVTIAPKILHLFQSHQCFQTIEFVDRTVQEKLYIFLCKISSQNKAWRCDMSQFLSPVFSVYTRNAWDHEPLLAQTHPKNKKRLHFLSLAAKANETNNDVNTTISGVSSCLSGCLSKY